jgi:ribosomal protein S18 acetylase RimI-like enzyme
VKAMKTSNSKAINRSADQEGRVQPSSLHALITDRSLTVSPLTVENEPEVLAFLAERPIHTFGLAGFIRDNGLVSPLNRGTFYCCRNEEGQIEGVALVGHATLFETRSDRAIAAFARLAQDCPNLFMLLGEEEKVARFWSYYAQGGRPLRLAARERLFQQSWPVMVREPVPGLRHATLDDLDSIVPIHALTVIDESGVNPLETDPEGFRKRCARRIEMRRTWVYIDEGKLVFKAEVVSESPEVTYLEGVWVAPGDRGKGIGMRCMSILGRNLLQCSESISLLVNERNREAQAFYTRAGYSFICHYETIFLR